MALINEDDKVIPVNEPSGMAKLVGQVAASYLGSQRVNGPGEIGEVIAAIHASLSKIDAVKEQPQAEVPAEETVRKPTPAEIRKSITPDFLISFEDGRKYKTLRRSLTLKGMTFADYKAKWSLPADYPAVAPNYSAARSAMAVSLGLGQKGRRAQDAKPAAAAKPAATAAKAKAPAKPRATKPKTAGGVTGGN